MNCTFKIGLLQCDHVSDEHKEVAGGDYSEVFKQLFFQSANRLSLHHFIELVSFPVIDGVFPKSPQECNAWVISGSKHSVFDPIDWIKQLEVFILEIIKNNLPLIGICFGHQIIALLLGGQVIKRKEWVAGLQKLRLTNNELLKFEHIHLYGMHEYEVIVPPVNAVVIASTEKVQIACYFIPPNILCLQYHIEFNYKFMKELIYCRRDIIGNTVYTKALNEMSEEIETKKCCDDLLCFMLKYSNVKN